MSSEEPATPSPSSSAPGRTAFDALNPYGDFGGTDPSSGRLLLVVLVCLVALGGLVIVGGLAVKDALVARAKKEAAAAVAAVEKPQQAPAVESATVPAVEPVESVPLSDEEATDDGDVSDVVVPSQDAVAAVAAVPTPPSPVGDAPSPDEKPRQAVSARRAPPPPQRALVLFAWRDRSGVEATGLADAMLSGFLRRLATVAPDVVIKRGGRPASTYLGVKLILTRVHEASGGGAHDVTVQCASGVRPVDAVPGGGSSAQGRSQGIEPSAALLEEAVRRCGAGLADGLASVAQSLD